MKLKGRRQSANVIDLRDQNFRSGTQRKVGNANLRQVFDPTLTKNLVKVVNRVVNSDRMNAKGPGMTKMRSAIKPVNKSTPKTGRVKSSGKKGK